MATNDITGDRIASKPLSQEGRDNWDKIFNKPKPEEKLKEYLKHSVPK